MRILIVDDEAPARRKLRDLLRREADVEVVGEAADGVEAVAAIRREAPDVVLLDVQMPRLDGFGVIGEVGVDQMPVVVFVTAFEEHALRAFEVQALDYLTKPFAPQRFALVLDRARRQLAGRPMKAMAQQFEQLLRAVKPSSGYLQQLFVEKGRDREVLLRLDTVDRIVADGNYLRFLTRDGEFLRRSPLSDVEARLDPEKFLRINRSEVIRLEAVAEFQPWFHGDYRVRMKDGTILTWSRRFRAKHQPEM